MIRDGPARLQRATLRLPEQVISVAYGGLVGGG